MEAVWCMKACSQVGSCHEASSSLPTARPDEQSSSVYTYLLYTKAKVLRDRWGRHTQTIHADGNHICKQEMFKDIGIKTHETRRKDFYNMGSVNCLMSGMNRVLWVQRSVRTSYCLMHSLFINIRIIYTPVQTKHSLKPSPHNWQEAEILSSPVLCRWKTKPQLSVGRRLNIPERQ